MTKFLMLQTIIEIIFRNFEFLKFLGIKFTTNRTMSVRWHLIVLQFLNPFMRFQNFLKIRSGKKSNMMCFRNSNFRHKFLLWKIQQKCQYCNNQMIISCVNYTQDIKVLNFRHKNWKINVLARQKISERHGILIFENFSPKKYSNIWKCFWERNQ